MVPRSLFWVAVVVVAVGGGYDVVGVVLGASGGAELDELGDEFGVDVGGRVADVLGAVLGGADGEGAGLVLGRGPGVPGSTWVFWCGHRNSPRPSPATTAAEPAARYAVRTLRRVRTPARSRSRCRGSKGAGSSVPCISRVSRCSKASAPSAPSAPPRPVSST
ncbi:hypothetical protein [Streptomyces murinus]|uniref:hypothetical protein n=1 Tax=Streptomyces murinus TaxID=33900 RepID=UPI002114B82E|nr:hypothetical protein [Streptomyces murinus]